MDNLQEEECIAPEFSINLIFNLQQLYDDQKLCDFTIKVDGKEFKVHKVVLASVSDYFRAMFDHDMIENQEDFTELKGLTEAGVGPLIGFFYYGTLRLNLGNIYDVMNAATFLQIIPAVNCCVQYLKNKLTFENAEYLLKIADLYSIPNLRSYYKKYILDNFLEYALTDQFLSLESETLANYLSDDSLNTTSECMLLHLVLNWYNHDPDSRKKTARSVFEKIRFVVDGWPILYFAIHLEPFKSLPELKNLIDFADSCLTNHHTRFLTNDLMTRVRYPKKSLIQIGGKIKLTDSDFLDFPDVSLDSFEDSFRIAWHKNHYYHADLKRWLPLGASEIGEKRTCGGTLTEVNGNAVLCGGYIHKMDEFGDEESDVTDETWLFTASDCRLRPLPTMKHPREGHAAVFLNGCLYAIGGCDDFKLLCSVEKLSGENGKLSWSYVRPLSVSIEHHAAVVCKNKIYISGGFEQRDRESDKVWCYSPELNRWHKKKSMWEKRTSHGMVNIKDVIYVMGGKNDTGILDTMETYNVETNTWTKLCTTLPWPTYKAATFVMDDKIWRVGGRMELDINDPEELRSDRIEEYDPKEDTWSIMGRLPRKLDKPACCVLTLKLTSDGQFETDEIYRKYEDLLEQNDLNLELENFYNPAQEHS